jgi:hypothetical protein
MDGLTPRLSVQGGTPELWIAQGSRHVMAMIDYTDEYEQKLVEFFKAAFGFTLDRVGCPYAATALYEIIEFDGARFRFGLNSRCAHKSRSCTFPSMALSSVSSLILGIFRRRSWLKNCMWAT